MNFNKKEFTNFRGDVVEALEQVGKKYGLSISTGNIKYTDLDFTMELKAVKQEEGVNVEQEKFNRDCIYYSFTPEHYGVEFTIVAEIFRLVGFNLNKPKNNCNIVRVKDGKRYMCNDEQIKHALKIK